MPSREIRGGDITNLAAAHEPVERVKRLLYRRRSVEPVHMVDVDVIRAEPPQTPFQLLDQVVARRADIIRPLAESKGRLCRNQQLVSFAGDRFAGDLLRKTVRIDIGRVDEI